MSDLDTGKEQIIEQIRHNLATTLGVAVEYVESEDFVVFRASNGSLHVKVFKDNGEYVDASLGSPGGGGSYEVASNSPANGTDTIFLFTGPPALVERNGVVENRYGTVVGNTFVFNTPPNEGDDVGGLV